MTINFALSLSHEGIEMLQRVHDGWRLLGHVDVNSPTLNADLTSLQTQAETLAGGAFTCKLIIPEDQIKYTVVDSELRDQSDIDAALINTTPYPLEALAVDHERADGKTLIAAVARETLQEAENFAAAHGFNPVAFVAVAPTGSFQREVFFGPTSVMPDILGSDANVMPDEEPVRLEGTPLRSTQVEITPPLCQRIWVDAIPPEHRHPSPAAEKPEPRQITLATPDLFDRIIAEVHPEPAAKPALVAVVDAPTRAAPQMTAAPVRHQAPVAAKTNKPLYVGLAACIALLAAVFGWTQVSSVTQTEAPEVTTILSPTDTPEIALQSVPDLGPTPPDEVAPFETAAVSDDPVLALLTEITTLSAPVIDLAPPSAPQIGPRVFTVAAPLFGEFAPAMQNLPAGLSTQEPSPVSSAPILAQATAPETAITAPQAPPPVPVTTAPPAVTQVATRGTVLSPAEALAFYEATGVWQRSPRLIDTPSGAILMGFQRPAPMTTPPRVGAPVFAVRPAELPIPFGAPRNPPPPDVVFARDENGFIAATPEGTLTPDGAIVISGLPDLPVRPRPQLSEADLERLALLAPAAPSDGVIVIVGPPDVIAPLRPDDLVVPEPESPAPLGGVGIAALELQQSGTIALDTATVEARAATDLRPQLRPSGLAAAADPNTTDITDILREIAASDATLRFDNSTALAVRVSIRPDTRPSAIARLAAAAQETQRVAPIVAAAPVPPQNFDPVPGGVARAATQEDVIRLREINLIGVYGRPNARRALLRLSNGRYVRVEVGSELDGGQVTAIGDEALNYVKRGRTYAVEMPSR